MSGIDQVEIPGRRTVLQAGSVPCSAKQL